MTDEPSSMFDYDARPVTPQVVLVGRRASTLGYELRDFLSRNGVPYDWVEIDDADRVAQLLGTGAPDPNQLPICVLPDGSQLAAATVEQVANGLGMVAAPLLPEYDVTIVGAGPAGLAAAVYAASEGLRTVAIEAVAPGGQAGTTSMIENYLGFPQGISGSELAARALDEAVASGPNSCWRGLSSTSSARTTATWSGSRMERQFRRGQCSRRAASTGVASTSTGSTSRLAPACTTARDRVKPCRAEGVASRLSAAATQPGKPRCGSRATHPT